MSNFFSNKDINDLEISTIRETNSVPGTGAVAVVNPDGTDIATNFTGTVTIADQVSKSSTSVIFVEIAAQILLPANTNRKMFYLVNQSNTATLFIQFGDPSVSTTFYVDKLGPMLAFVSDNFVYTGIIYGVWDIADLNGFCLATDTH